MSRYMLTVRDMSHSLLSNRGSFSPAVVWMSSGCGAACVSRTCRRVWRDGRSSSCLQPTQHTRCKARDEVRDRTVFEWGGRALCAAVSNAFCYWKSKIKVLGRISCWSASADYTGGPHFARSSVEQHCTFKTGSRHRNCPH